MTPLLLPIPVHWYYTWDNRLQIGNNPKQKVHFNPNLSREVEENTRERRSRKQPGKWAYVCGIAENEEGEGKNR
jgi:hypothetical protein